MPAAELTVERRCGLDRRAAELFAAGVARAVGGDLLGVRRLSRIAIAPPPAATPSDFEAFGAGEMAIFAHVATRDEFAAMDEALSAALGDAAGRQDTAHAGTVAQWIIGQ